MKQLLIQYLPWFLSLVTIYSLWLVGNKNSTGWIITIVNQLLWAVWILVSHNWGFVPMNIAMWCIAIRNFSMWYSEEQLRKDPEKWFRKMAADLNREALKHKHDPDISNLVRTSKSHD